MSKFNVLPAAPTPDAYTAQGGEGFARSPKDELFLLGVANTVGESTFYESADDRDRRFVELVEKCTADDHEWTAAYIGWLRGQANMRSAPIVAAAAYVKAGGPHGRAVVNSVLQRPDEPGEMLAYWTATYGRAIPKPVKRGVADAAVRMFTERNVLKYDGTGKPWRFGDVVDLVHPSPKDDRQSALFRYCIDRRHNRDEFPEQLQTIAQDRLLMGLPEDQRRGRLGDAVNAGWSWERLAGWLPGGMDAAAWEAIIPNMGLMALVRNLRNFDQANISNDATAMVVAKMCDPVEVRKSRQFPIRFLSAWKNVASMRWGHGLETALGHSVANVSALPGRTLVLLDVSPSMRDTAIGGHRGTGVSPERWEVASVFALALAARAADAKVVLFDFNPVADMKVGPNESILRLTESVKRFVDNGNGTDTLKALASAYDGHDRVIIVTDEQTGANAGAGTHNFYGGYTHTFSRWEDVKHIKAPVYTWNLAGYQTGHTPQFRNWVTFGGLNDASFGALDAFEARRHSAPWPWEINAQTP